MTTIGPGERRTSRARVTALSAIVSIAVHGSVLAAAMTFWRDTTPGAIPRPSEAITLELHQSEVVEAVPQSIAIEATASRAAVAAEAGEEQEAAPSAAPVREVAEISPEPIVETVAPAQPDTIDAAPEGLELLEGTAPADEIAGRETDRERGRPAPPQKPAEHAPRKPKAQAEPKRTAKLTAPLKTDKRNSTPKKKGGAASKANAGSAASKARASASAGSAINYAAIVRARVAARKPAGGGRRGTVVINFGVSRSGAVSYASIARSSGNPGLDRSVLSAVRGTGFPAPPPGAGTRFSVPFYFR